MAAVKNRQIRPIVRVYFIALHLQENQTFIIKPYILFVYVLQAQRSLCPPSPWQQWEHAGAYGSSFSLCMPRLGSPGGIYTFLISLFFVQSFIIQQIASTPVLYEYQNTRYMKTRLLCKDANSE